MCKGDFSESTKMATMCRICYDQGYTSNSLSAVLSSIFVRNKWGMYDNYFPVHSCRTAEISG